MKKSVIFWWFLPLFIFLLHCPYLYNAIFKAESVSFEGVIIPYFDGVINAGLSLFGDPPSIFGGIISYCVLPLIVVGSSVVLPCVGVFHTVEYLTDNMGESSTRSDKDYLVATVDGDKLKIEQGSEVKTTAAGWLRRLMYFTYLFWCIPVFIVHLVRAQKSK